MIYTGFAQIPVIYWTDILDILVVAYLIYKGIFLVRETRAEQLMKGIILLLALLQVSHWLKLNTISFIIRNVLQFGVIALLIVFQPELRRALEKIGRSKLSNIINIDSDSANNMQGTVDALFYACRELSAKKIGALIVIERETKIGEIIRTGVPMDSKISWELLVNLFVPNTPLHDGAVIVRGDKVMAAGCFLPLSENLNFSSELGTRHRAAIGVSEVSDAIAVVVSEETGIISLATGGTITRNLSPNSMRNMLETLLHVDEPQERKKKLKLIQWRRKS